MAALTNYHKCYDLKYKFFHRSWGQKSETNITWLKSKCPQDWTASGGVKGDSIPCLSSMWYLPAFLGLWLHYTILCLSDYIAFFSSAYGWNLFHCHFKRKHDHIYHLGSNRIVQNNLLISKILYLPRYTNISFSFYFLFLLYKVTFMASRD